MDFNNILLYSFIAATSLQALYHLIFMRFAFAKSGAPTNNEQLPISVIVVGRNESENFRKFLPLLCQQEYPQFEIVAVNDQSVDDSKFVIEELMDTYSNLRMVNVKENDRFWLGKKFGLTLGIKGASYENLLLTDADCKPASKYWIKEMASGLSQKPITIGYGAYENKPGLLNFFIQYETIQTAIQYFSYALLGMPYMGVGRNLAYSRELFFKHRGFVDHMHIPSGDDDLFIQQVANRKNVKTIFSKEAHTISVPKTSWKEWIKQKKRHFKTAKHYKGFHQFALGLFGFSQMAFFVLFALTLIFTPFKTEALTVFGIRLLLQYLVFTFSTLKLGSKRILWLLPLLEIFTWHFQAYAIIVGRINKKKSW